MSTKIKDCSNEREACDATHSVLAASHGCNPASVPRWNLSRARPRGIKLQSKSCSYWPRQACSDHSLDFKPQTGLQTMKLQSPDNSPNSRHQSVAAQDAGLLSPIMTWQLPSIFVGKLQTVSLCCDYCSSTLKRRHEYWLSGRKIAKLAPKNPSRGGENKLWIGEFRRTLRPGVCNYKTENPPRLMNVLCRTGMLVMCYLLLAFVFCISLPLRTYCLHIRLLLELCCPWQGRDKHRDIIEYWLYFDEGGKLG